MNRLKLIKVLQTAPINNPQSSLKEHALIEYLLWWYYVTVMKTDFFMVSILTQSGHKRSRLHNWEPG